MGVVVDEMVVALPPNCINLTLLRVYKPLAPKLSWINSVGRSTRRTVQYRMYHHSQLRNNAPG